MFVQKANVLPPNKSKTGLKFNLTSLSYSEVSNLYYKMVVFISKRIHTFIAKCVRCITKWVLLRKWNILLLQNEYLLNVTFKKNKIMDTCYKMGTSYKKFAYCKMCLPLPSHTPHPNKHFMTYCYASVVYGIMFNIYITWCL